MATSSTSPMPLGNFIDMFYKIVENERHQTKPMLIISGVISVCAAVTNGASLSYFIRCGRGGLGNKLLIFLNLLDLLYCLLMTVSIGLQFVAFGRPAEHFADYQDIYMKSNAITYVFEEETGFATLLLSVTRCIIMFNPFYRIKIRPIILSSVIFFAYLLVKNVAFIICYDLCFNSWTEQQFKLQIGGEMMLIIGIVLTANVAAVSKLQSAPKDLGQERASLNRQVTLTVFTLSIVFCCLNIFKYAVVFSVVLNPEFPFKVEKIANLIAIPLNSALNPVIYTIRTHSMRQYALDLLRCSDRPLQRMTEQGVGGLSSRQSSNNARISAVQNQTSTYSVEQSMVSMRRGNSKTKD